MPWRAWRNKGGEYAARRGAVEMVRPRCTQLTLERFSQVGRLREWSVLSFYDLRSFIGFLWAGLRVPDPVFRPTLEFADMTTPPSYRFRVSVKGWDCVVSEWWTGLWLIAAWPVRLSLYPAFVLPCLCAKSSNWVACCLLYKINRRARFAVCFHPGILRIVDLCCSDISHYLLHIYRNVMVSTNITR